MGVVDVIIPTHNRSELLRAAILSVLQQTYTNFQITVVDDASEDDSANMVLAFRDSRLHYLRHEVNRGEAAAHNTGIARSRSLFVAFLDDDDCWLPHKLERQIAVMSASPPRVAGVYCGGCGSAFKERAETALEMILLCSADLCSPTI
jgi:glycosyltransferase involved in cell wall biosynthesis